MNLIQESSAFAAWFARVMRTFFQLRPLTTAGVVVAEATATMTRILSLLLPLKVILLAGSPGVPRYFPFVDPADKSIWLLGLSLAAVTFYLVTLLLEAMVNRLSQDAGKEILYRANALTLLKNQEETIQGYYASFCEISASLLFLSAAFLVLMVLNFWLFIFMLFLMAGYYFFSAWALSGCDVRRDKLKLYIQDKTGNYLKIITSLAFLAGFFIILAPFLTSDGGNIIIAILSILLLRRSLNFFVSSTKEAVNLCRNKHKIDALIFPGIQMESPEGKDKLAVRDVFHKSARESMVQAEMSLLMPPGVSLDVHWMDPTIPGMYMFMIKTGKQDSHQEALFQKQVFTTQSAQLFENEDYLFTRISRNELKAPALVTRYTREPFVCQILEYGLGEPVPGNKWKSLHDNLLEYYYSIKPSPELVKAFRTSHKSLHEILSREFVSRTWIAVDTPEEKSDLNLFLEYLPGTECMLKSVPYFIHNPDLTVKNTVQTEAGEVLVMTWGRWTLEPLGAVMPFDQKRLDQLLEVVKENRTDTPKDLDLDRLDLVHYCRTLEKEISKGNYKAALTTINKVLSNPVLKSP
ncbi:hypothetical protein [Desulfonatronospira sp.]|uniref:hypothetical protein n=1 Tax=Desulfonatronospira sp. TaxID=1962951 RepID=UPI0025C3C0EC|nr:hypothetical protein [Desulfonatronospira sp.]